MPQHDAYTIALKRAREGAALKAHTKGSVPPYLWPIMEIAYLCRMRGAEVIAMTDAHETEKGLFVSRLKGSNDNVVSWTPRLRAAWDAALAIRANTLARPKNRGRPVPLRREDRYVFVNQSGHRLSKGALDQAWQDFMKSVIATGVLTQEQRFTLHGLKHRGITDTVGNKADKQTASGHKTQEQLDRYDHDAPLWSRPLRQRSREGFGFRSRYPAGIFPSDWIGKCKYLIDWWAVGDLLCSYRRPTRTREVAPGEHSRRHNPRLSQG